MYVLKYAYGVRPYAFLNGFVTLTFSCIRDSIRYPDIRYDTDTVHSRQRSFEEWQECVRFLLNPQPSQSHKLANNIDSERHN